MHGYTQERCRACWKYDTPLEIIKKERLRLFGRVVRANYTMASTILQGSVKGKITMKTSKTAIGRSKGIDRLRLCEIWKEAEDLVSFRKRFSRVAPNGLSSLQDSR